MARSWPWARPLQTLPELVIVLGRFRPERTLPRKEIIHHVGYTEWKEIESTGSKKKNKKENMLITICYRLL